MVAPRAAAEDDPARATCVRLRAKEEAMIGAVMNTYVTAVAGAAVADATTAGAPPALGQLNLIVHGGPDRGKSRTVHKVIEALQRRSGKQTKVSVSKLDCRDATSGSGALLAAAARALGLTTAAAAVAADDGATAANGADGGACADGDVDVRGSKGMNGLAFCSLIRSHAARLGKRTQVLILEHADAILFSRGAGSSTLAQYASSHAHSQLQALVVLMRLSEEMRLRCGMVLVMTSSVSFESFRNASGGAAADLDPLSVYFREWTDTELAALLEAEARSCAGRGEETHGPTGTKSGLKRVGSLMLPASCSSSARNAKLFEGFVRQVVPILARESRRYGAIRQMVAFLWPQYIEPIDSGRLQWDIGRKRSRESAVDPMCGAEAEAGDDDVSTREYDGEGEGEDDDDEDGFDGAGSFARGIEVPTAVSTTLFNKVRTRLREIMRIGPWHSLEDDGGLPATTPRAGIDIQQRDGLGAAPALSTSGTNADRANGALDLPSSSQLLLVAAYIGSRNKSTLDSKIFSDAAGAKAGLKNGSGLGDASGGGGEDNEEDEGDPFSCVAEPTQKPKRRRRTKGGIVEQDHQAEEARKNSKRAPGLVTLERLLAIYSVIAHDANANNSDGADVEAAVIAGHGGLTRLGGGGQDDGCDSVAPIPLSIAQPSQCVMMSLSSLCECRLLDSVGNDVIDSGSLKYRCNIDQGVAESLARNLRVMMQEYIRFA